MIVEKISLLVPFVDDQFGTYLQKKVTMDIILQEGDTPEKALDYALETVTAWNESTKKSKDGWERITDLPASLKPTVTIQAEPQLPEDQRLQFIIADIEKCTTIPKPDGIDSYYSLAKQYPPIMEAYEKKKAELVKKETDEILAATEANCLKKPPQKLS